MPYTVFQRPGDERGHGGMLDMTGQLPAEVPPHWLPYFAVENTDKIVARSGELGGSVIMPATDIPTVGRIAILKDPQGAVFAVIKTAM
jgi:predicted enzyme related to lactoylglutathione lyase